MTEASMTEASMTEASTGPGSRRARRRSSGARARSARNATTHGLTASVVPPDERAAFERHRRRLRAELAPVGYLEAILVDRVARAAWHRDRLERWDAAARVTRLRDALEYALYRARVYYEPHLDDPGLPGEADPGQLDLPRTLAAVQDLTGWDPRLTLLGDPAALPPPAVLDARAGALFERLRGLLAERVGRALLADDADLARYVRYAAQHDREFYRALHELEARQRLRRGEPAPLARLELHGDPEWPGSRP